MKMAPRKAKAKPKSRRENTHADNMQAAGLKPCQKGYTGNPGGRPKEIRQLKELARENTAEAIATIVQIMRDKEAPPAARVLAADKLLDRGYGKATQHIEANVNHFDGMTNDELTDYIARGAAKLGIGGKQRLAGSGKATSH